MSLQVSSQFRDLSAFQSLDWLDTDRKSTRLNSSHQIISYAVFCLKKKKNTKQPCFGCTTLKKIAQCDSYRLPTVVRVLPAKNAATLATDLRDPPHHWRRRVGSMCGRAA